MSGGSGAPLGDGVRSRMESAFNTDFSDVRVHTGSAASSMGALAYAQGTDLHFAPGQYAPDTQRGQEVLGHELAHVQQQRAGEATIAQAKDGDIVADKGLEAEADAAGRAAARGASVSGVSGGGGGVSGDAPVQRLTEISKENLLTQDGSNCGLFSMMMVMKAKGAKLDGVQQKLMDAAQIAGSEVGELFTFDQVAAAADAVGYKVTKVAFTDGKDLMSKAAGTKGGALIAYSYTGLNDIDAKKAYGLKDDTQTAHWSVISSVDQVKNLITIANPHGVHQTYGADKLADNNKLLDKQSFDWDGFKGATKSQSLKKSGQEAFDLGGFIVDFEPK